MGINHLHREAVVRRDGPVCHFCKNIALKRGEAGPKSKRLLTIDHVIPVAWGGQNSMSNYVVACAGCNNEKDNNLFYCKCAHCMSIIVPFMQTAAYRKRLKHHKPKIKKVIPHKSKPRHVWAVLMPGHEKKFITHSEAVGHAKMKMRTYCGDSDYLGAVPASV